jgi:hypothetical protein
VNLGFAVKDFFGFNFFPKAKIATIAFLASVRRIPS